MMLGKDKPKSYDVFVIGEQVRVQMHKAHIIKDRRYHLRKYRMCFVGRDAIDWLLKMRHAQHRGEAVLAMRCLCEHGMIHHVVDDHEFKDDHLFYRFTFDDDKYKLNNELVVFYRGLQVFERLKEAKIRRDFYHKGHQYQGAFNGCDLVDCLQDDEAGHTRAEVIRQCRELLEYDIIGHVTDDYHFNDDRLMYQFRVDYDRPCLLSDVLQPFTNTTRGHPAQRTAPVSSEAGKVERAEEAGSDGNDGEASGSYSSQISAENDCLHRNDSRKSDTRNSNNDLDTRSWSSRDVEESRTATTKRDITLQPDAVGYGFVLRGSAPCYVHTIDPLGPAAAAGLKVGQYVISVSGQDVVKEDHRSVGKLVMRHTGHLSLVVM